MRRRVDTLYHHVLAHVLSCVLQMDYRVSVDTCINVCINVTCSFSVAGDAAELRVALLRPHTTPKGNHPPTIVAWDEGVVRDVSGAHLKPKLSKTCIPNHEIYPKMSPSDSGTFGKPTNSRRDDAPAAGIVSRSLDWTQVNLRRPAERPVSSPR